MLVPLLLAPVACGRDGNDAPEVTPAALKQAQDDAAEALSAVEGLEEDLDEALSELEEARSEANEGADKVDKRLGYLSNRLKNAIDSLRASLADVRASASGAASEVDSALAKAEQAAKDLAVLESRFNYHLRRDHGGG